MSKREKCVYCGKVIVTRSKEHIIQNAIGGLYESEDICCDKCNNYLSTINTLFSFRHHISPDYRTLFQ